MAFGCMKEIVSCGMDSKHEIRIIFFLGQERNTWYMYRYNTSTFILKKNLAHYQTYPKHPTKH